MMHKVNIVLLFTLVLLSSIIAQPPLIEGTYTIGSGGAYTTITEAVADLNSLGVDGGFIESQAFGYLAIRSYLKFPISFPETTGCKEQCSGGVIAKNY